MSKYIKIFGKRAKKVLERQVDSDTKNKVLKSFLFFLEKNKKKILNQNKKDIKFAEQKNLKLNLSFVINKQKIRSYKKIS